jgi:hypothetical protein
MAGPYTGLRKAMGPVRRAGISSQFEKLDLMNTKK